MFYFNADAKTNLRYDLAKFVAFSNMYDILDSFLVIELKKIPPVGSYVVTADEFRPDLICANIYKDDNAVQLKQLLLLYNDIIDYTSLKSGTLLYYPSMEAIENIYYRLKAQS